MNETNAGGIEFCGFSLFIELLFLFVLFCDPEVVLRGLKLELLFEGGQKVEK